MAGDSSPRNSEVQMTISHITSLRHEDLGSELFVLATNFLLYIALVILTILLQRIYFPHTMPEHSTAPHLLDDEDEATAAEYGEQHESASLKQQRRSGDSSDGGLPLDTALFSEPLQPSRLERSESSDAFLSSVLDFKTYNQEHFTKKQVLQRLLTCTIGLNVSFVICGILQERMLTQPYNDGEFFTSSYGLVFLNRLGGFIISALLYYLTSPPPTKAVFYEFSFPSVSNMLSSWCQYEALKYVSFPTQTLFKCFKMVPVMLMGKVIGNKAYPSYDYAVAIMIGFGISIFMVSTEPMDFGLTSAGLPETWGGTLCGLVLLFLFLCFDSFTGQWQSRMFHRNEDLSPAVMMLMVNAFSLVFSGITLIHTKEMGPFIEFLARHPEVHMHVVVFSVCNTIGQIFIFQTIRSFGAVVFAIVMNTRIILSILFSCLIYHHKVSSQGFFGLFIVFASVAYRIKRKTTGGLVKWREQQEQGKDWFKEVHEHMDM